MLEAGKVLSSERMLPGTETLLAEAVKEGLLSLDAGEGLLAELVELRYRPKVRSLHELM